MFCAGIDSGSRTVKAVVLDAATSAIVASAMVDAGVDAAATATTLFDLALAEAGVARTAIARLVATGYARAAVPGADARITEITCHARGVRHLLPAARSVVEIGGQDSKVLRLDERGVVADFAMNDRCAAGTGRFLEVMARASPPSRAANWPRRWCSPAVWRASPAWPPRSAARWARP